MEQWVATQRAALGQEREEEKSLISDALAQRSAQECQDLGVSLLHLVISGTHTGLYGRTCISLGPSLAIRRDGSLPAHGFGVGDEVRLTSSKGGQAGGAKASVEGVVCRVSPSRLDFLVGSSEDVDDDLLDAWSSATASLRLDMLCNEATHRKMMEALTALERYRDGPALRLINLLFGNTASPTEMRRVVPLQKTVSADLNESQREAVAFALETDDVALIHGPPGTGKTTAVVELILQAVVRGQRLLVCAPSNVAVDNIVERIVAARAVQTGPKPRIVRLGHPARLSAQVSRQAGREAEEELQVLDHSLEALIEAADGTDIVRDIRAEMRGLEGKRPRDRDSRRVWRGELKVLKKEMRVREEQVVRQIIQTRDIVLCTNVGAATKVLGEEVFDLLVIDEAAQALEASCWIPVLKAPRLVLAGDHKQLAPTIKSAKADKMGLGVTLFDRLMKLLGTTHARMLNVQYRMHHTICDWASHAVYGGALVPAEAVATRTLSGLPYVRGAEDMTECPMLLLDTAGCGMEEEEEEDAEEGEKKPDGGSDDKGKKKRKGGSGGLLSKSSSNRGEALVVEAHVRALLATGLRQEDVAVITPYNGQVERLRSILAGEFPNLEIRSVDGFQGGEREAVVLSLVRSNAQKTVGFLADDRRLNVAVTRAKRHCAIICDSETVSKHPFLGGLVRYVEEHGEYRSALEYLPDWGGGGGGGAAMSGGKAISGTKGGGQSQGGAAGERKGKQASTVGKKERAGAADARRGGAGKEQGRGGAKASEGGSEGGERGHEGGGDGGKDSVDDNELVASVLRFAMAPAPQVGSKLELSPDLSGRQRKLVHDLVDQLGAKHVSHESTGTGRARRLVLTIQARSGTATLATAAVMGADGDGGAVEEAATPSPFALVKEENEEEEDEEEDQDGGESSVIDDTKASAGGGGGAVVNGNSSKSKAGKKKAKKKTKEEVVTGLASMTGGFVLGTSQQAGGSVKSGGGGGVKKAGTGGGNSLLSTLHAARQARQSAAPQAPPPPPPEATRAISASGGGGGGGAKAGEEVDDMELLEQAIASNMAMTELDRDPSEGMKSWAYGWNVNLSQKKELQKKLGEKIKDSVNDRKPTSKDDKKSGKKKK